MSTLTRGALPAGLELHLAAYLGQAGLDLRGLGLERQELCPVPGDHPEIDGIACQRIGEHGFARLEQGADLVDRYRLEAGEFVVLGETAGELGVDCLDRLAGGGDVVAQALFEGWVTLLGGLAEGAGEVGFGPGTAGFGVLAVADEFGQFAVALGEAGGHLGHGIGGAGGLHQLGDLETFVGDAGERFDGGVNSENTQVPFKISSISEEFVARFAT